MTKNWQILKRPVISEKSMEGVAQSRFTFEVDRIATKKEIKKAVESQFQVNVKGVKTLIVKPKSRWSGQARKKAYKQAFKKAIVQLAQGQNIDLFETQAPKKESKKEKEKRKDKKEKE